MGEKSERYTNVPKLLLFLVYTNWIMTPIQSIEILKENEEINSFKNSIFHIPKKTIK